MTDWFTQHVLIVRILVNSQKAKYKTGEFWYPQSDAQKTELVILKKKRTNSGNISLKAKNGITKRSEQIN